MTPHFTPFLLTEVNLFLLFLIFLGTAFIQVFIGGMRPVFAIPAYLILALAAFASVGLLRRRRPLPSVVCMLSSGLFFSYILWRAYASPVEYLSRPDRYMVLACLIVYLVFALYVTEPRTRLWFFYGLFLLAIGHVVIGAIQFSQGENYLPFGYLRADYERRASGFYVCPNHYAGLLEMLAVIAAAIAFWARIGFKTRMVVFYFILMAVGGLALSGSRGGYLSLSVGFVVFAVLSILVVRVIRPGRAIAVAAVAIAVLFFAGLAGVKIMHKDVFLSSRLNTITDSRNDRIQLWETALHIYQTQPVIGAGAGTYFYLGRLYRDPKIQSDPIWVHNDYLHLLAEYGWLGALGCGLFLLAHVGHGIASIRAIIKNRLLGHPETHSTSLALTLGALAAIAALVAHSVVDFNAHIPGNALLLAALFGILANPPTFRSRDIEPSLLTVLPLRLVLPILALALCLDAGPHLPGEWYSEKARVALRDRRYLLALREAQRGLELEKTNPELHYYLGEARRLLGNSWKNETARNNMNEAALNAFHDSIRLFALDETVWVKMAQALDMMGRHDEAFDTLEKARSLDPHLEAFNTYYAAHYQIQGDNKKALEYYQKSGLNEPGIAGREQVINQIKSDGAR